MQILDVIGRSQSLFDEDIKINSDELSSKVNNSSFLVIGGAGSISQSVCKEIFRRNPKKLHVIDISENNLVELVREVRSTYGYIDGEFSTFVIDCGSIEFDSFVNKQDSYDYVFNLSALKHVRSEKDPYTLMRMVMVNIFNTISTLQAVRSPNLKKYFCVSTDKAANPVNMMGASKRIMEMFLMRESVTQNISTARFANVAFSDGSLLHGFNQRFTKKQPFTAPNDVKRYFLTPQESGELCLMSALLGKNREIFFPKLSDKLHLISFSSIATRYLESNGFEPHECESEDEARDNIPLLLQKKKWPVYFFRSDTTGEKDFEEFFTLDEDIDMERYDSIGIIKNDISFEEEKLDSFTAGIMKLRSECSWEKSDILELFCKLIPGFKHEEKYKNLDQKM